MPGPAAEMVNGYAEKLAGQAVVIESVTYPDGTVFNLVGGDAKVYSPEEIEAQEAAIAEQATVRCCAKASAFAGRLTLTCWRADMCSVRG
jgi:hypothetical protein